MTTPVPSSVSVPMSSSSATASASSSPVYIGAAHTMAGSLAGIVGAGLTRELECTYLKLAAASGRATNAHNSPPGANSDAAQSLSSRGSPVAVIATPVQINSFGIQNLELMHKYATETYQSLCVSESETQIWRITVPRLALKHDYLMNGILALASMHIATSSEPTEALLYQDTGLQYYNRSLNPFRNAIDNITPQNCDAVFAHSIVMIAISIASPRPTVIKDGCSSFTDNIVILFELLQGVKTIMQFSQSWINLKLFSQGEFWTNTATDLDTDTEAALTYLSVLNDQLMVGAYSHQHHIMKDVISHLRHCYAKFARSADPAAVLAWLAAVESEFVYT
ncbi:hypothetical protein PENANT_c001G03484 [Penicillium antarcticum]|uniref:C6 transcription factor n=1 Tax=Penicillium antarcticum TaxID=416450 RepID=A0A1V6QNT5_9EURO|nr:hypothetical protein PENANT_c001G03484 [Penicillium antarcticum]